MIRNVLLSITTILLLSPVFVNAQVIREISKDPQVFPEELIRMAESINKREDKKEAEEFTMQFNRMWASDTLNSEQKRTVVKTINRMLQKRISVDPSVFKYLHTVYELCRTDHFDKDFKGMTSGLDYFFKRLQRSHIEETIARLEHFVKDKTLTTHTSSTWKSTSDTYKIRFDDSDRTFKIEIPKTDLIAYAYKDSSVIYNTSGYYDLRRNRWYGNDGIVTWETAGYDPDVVYARLNEYDINMRFTKYRVNRVNFFHKEYFSEPLLGRLSNQTEVGSTSREKKRVNYPRFVASEGQKTINNIFPGVDYNGGFSMLGSRLVASSSKKSLASILISKDEKPFIRLKSKNFAMDSARIKSDLSSLTIYLDEDSIYHPAISFTYDNNSQLLSIYRDQEGLSRSPFFDTYHMVDIDVEAMFWNIDEEKILLRNIPSSTGRNTAFFRSMNFFDEREFGQIKGMDRTNPMYHIQSFYENMGMKEFHLNSMVKYIGYAPHMVKAMLLRLANMGFLNYNLNNDMITIRDRLFHYLEARQGKRDYDVINFNSRTQQKSNGELSLLNYDMKLYGIRTIQLSDSQNVVINPKENSLTLKKNRDFEFDGMIKAGRFVVHGNGFEFSYEKFGIEMPLIDSMQFWVKPFEEDKDKYASRKYVESTIQDMQGELIIDRANNKSGRKSFPKYPILKNEKNAYVYYNKNCIYPNVYKPDEFYYRLDPFTIDSLDNFTTEGLQFTGYLASSGIFPIINQPLAVQKDYSLGFIHNTPSTGYNIYGGKGHYTDQIRLSNQGLEGSGELKYLTAKAKSVEFDFFPDSTNAMANEYVVQEQSGQVQYPAVTATNVRLHWEPYNDIMTVRSQEKPVNMFNQQANIDGTLKYTPDKMTGKGMMHIADADISSDRFVYAKQDIYADTCDFKLIAKSDEFGLGAGDRVEHDLITNNYKAEISFKTRKGKFTSNSGSSRVKFLVNQYIGFIDQFNWHMDKEEIAFSSRISEKMAGVYDQYNQDQLIDSTLRGARFISIHPAQDSLEFIADYAVYSRKQQTLDAKGVRILRVADAAIFPVDKQLLIKRRAEITPLQKATILTNTTTRFHQIYNATVNIDGKYQYHARGDYDYVDKNKEIQTIYLNDIAVNKNRITIASGDIKQDDDFKLSPAFKFKGQTNLISTDQYLTFDGGFSVRNQCDTMPDQWVKFKSVIRPDSVMLPVDSNATTIHDRATYASIMHAKDRKQIYSSFFTQDNTHRLRQGNTIFTSHGYLMYDEVSSEYRLASKERLNNKTARGNYTAYNTRDCIHTGEGEFNFFEETGQVDLQMLGKAEHYILDDSTQISGTLAIDFLFDEDALEYMANSINSYNNLKGVELNSDRFKSAIRNMVKPKIAEELIKEINLYNKIEKVPDEFKRTMILTDVSLKWDDYSQSFISTEPVGIAFLGEEQVTRYVDAYILFNKGRRGGFREGEFTILLEISSAEWYYFNYRPTGAMTVVAASDEFKTIISELKSKDREQEATDDKRSFRYNLGGSIQREQFLRNMKRLTGDR